jgi:type II secretory pathway pseudopilin PulG
MSGSSKRVPVAQAEGVGGMTLVEVVIAMALVALMSAGLISVGLATRRFSEHNRIITEARTLAKDRIEDLVATRIDNLTAPGLTLMNSDTNLSSRGYPIVRSVQLVWHAADGTVAASTGTYAEVSCNVSFMSPLYKKTMTNTYSMLIQ